MKFLPDSLSIKICLSLISNVLISSFSFIEGGVKIVLNELGVEKIDAFDVFAGSGIVSRFLKQYSNNLYVNDLEDYSYTINRCYLTNEDEIDRDELNKWYGWTMNLLNNEELIKDGFIAKLYAPVDDKKIQQEERVFYTTRNAQYIDTARQYLNNVPDPYKTLLLGPLLYEASTKNNTAGVFKGFYKNSYTHIGQYGGDGQKALRRILADIELKIPILSQNHCNVNVLQGDSNEICKQLPHVDLAYVDPPYNQHPYASNYFMLNLINNYEEPINISKVSGIPIEWNKSSYNKKKEAIKTMKDLCLNLKAKYILISYSSEGIISFGEMVSMLEKLGNVKFFKKKYNTFKGARNFKNRASHVMEYLFLLEKRV